MSATYFRPSNALLMRSEYRLVLPFSGVRTEVLCGTERVGYIGFDQWGRRSPAQFVSVDGEVLCEFGETAVAGKRTVLIRDAFQNEVAEFWLSERRLGGSLYGLRTHLLSRVECRHCSGDSLFRRLLAMGTPNYDFIVGAEVIAKIRSGNTMSRRGLNVFFHDLPNLELDRSAGLVFAYFLLWRSRFNL